MSAPNAPEPARAADLVRERLDAAETCARLLRDHLTGDGGFGGKPKRLDCAGCRGAVETWERAALTDGPDEWAAECQEFGCHDPDTRR